MVRITKVYTRQGDQGETHLAGGGRVTKDSVRIQVIGEVDELNAQVGFAMSAMDNLIVLRDLQAQCVRIQNELFNLGAQLSILPKHRWINTPIIKSTNITLLEQEIDDYNLKIAPLKSFILPGGGEVAARLHVARTVCRRAKRSILALLRQAENLDGTEIPYFNRLIDWLFVAARFSTLELNKRETLWQTC